nr:transposase domain-containing protein [Providencia rettgeri]
MLLSQLSSLFRLSRQNNLQPFSGLLSAALIDEHVVDTGVITIRKHRIPMEMMVWAVIGMPLFRSLSMAQLVLHLEIVLSSKWPYVSPGDVVQARQRSGEDSIRRVFE